MIYLTNKDFLTVIDVFSKRCVYKKYLPISCNRVKQIKPINIDKMFMQIEINEQCLTWYIFNSNLGELISLNSFSSEIENNLDRAENFDSPYTKFLNNAEFVKIIEENIIENDVNQVEKLSDLVGKIEILEEKIDYYEQFDNIEELHSLHLKIFSFLNANFLNSRLVDYFIIKYQLRKHDNSNTYNNLLKDFIYEKIPNKEILRLIEFYHS